MPIVLTVDDSSSIRSIVGKALREMGFAIEQAEDGEKGLALLAATKVDLILLDVTMPVMDGPTMLKALRARGDRTPVIMLTSESKRSVIAGALQLGIEDYMLKPFKPDELRHKVHKALKLPEAPAAAPAAAPAPVAPAPPPPAAAPVAATPAAAPAVPARPAADLLIVDDMENVHKKLRASLPDHVTMHGALGVADAIDRCGSHRYRLMLIDMDLPDVDSVALLRQVRALQPQASFLALVLRSATDPWGEATSAGFHGHVCKPFDPESITALVNRVFEARDLLEVDGSVITANGCESKDDKIERHYARLRPALKDAVAALAAACNDEVILDLRRVPMRAERTIHTIIDVDREARDLGLRFRLVVAPEVTSILRRVADTADISVFDSVERARGMAA